MLECIISRTVFHNPVLRDLQTIYVFAPFNWEGAKIWTVCRSPVTGSRNTALEEKVIHFMREYCNFLNNSSQEDKLSFLCSILNKAFFSSKQNKETQQHKDSRKAYFSNIVGWESEKNCKWDYCRQQIWLCAKLNLDVISADGLIETERLEHVNHKHAECARSVGCWLSDVSARLRHSCPRA